MAGRTVRDGRGVASAVGAAGGRGLPGKANSSAEVWLNLQSRYDLEKAEDDALPERIAREVRPAAERAG